LTLALLANSEMDEEIAEACALFIPRGNNNNYRKMVVSALKDQTLSDIFIETSKRRKTVCLMNNFV